MSLFCCLLIMIWFFLDGKWFPDWSFHFFCDSNSTGRYFVKIVEMTWFIVRLRRTFNNHSNINHHSTKYHKEWDWSNNVLRFVCSKMIFFFFFIFLFLRLFISSSFLLIFLWLWDLIRCCCYFFYGYIFFIIKEKY